ncbi:ferredoxin [Streptomyces sp. NA02950]|uniref:ferredoxin n=1 Tax=Streptomyces sp. NA02950 TaxID=2742137 RepID=UPI00159230B4|nr:ferredoxin [Streptomyces sp. NA02950]QKV93978.1 ferredoxin [Streptomyces sp. NA02950]
MRIVVDLNRCQGYAQCAFLAPDVFTMHGEEALLYNPYADGTQRENVARAAAACPVQAILVEDLDTDGADRAAGRPARAETTGVR